METLQEKLKKVEEVMTALDTQIINTQNALNTLFALKQQAIGKVNLLKALITEQKSKK